MTQKIILPVLVAALLLAACGKRSEEAATNEGSGAVVEVGVMPVTTGPAITTVHAMGRTDALRKEKIVAPIGGVITGLTVVEGSLVRAGETIAVIRTKESQAAIAGAEALLQAAESEQERKDAGRALDRARAADYGLAVKTHIGGYVALRMARNNETIAENAEILSIIDVASMVVIAQAPFQQAAAIAIGQSASVEIASRPGQRYPATVEAILPQAQLENQTTAIRLRFAGGRGGAALPLQTDLVASVTINTGRRANAMFIAKKAVIRDDEAGRDFVFTLTPDSLARSITVHLGVQADSLVEIISDQLHPGMPIVVEGCYGLKDSIRVEVH